MSPSRSSYCFPCVCLCLLFSVSLIEAAVNIDVLEPIVRISPVRGMLGGAAQGASADFFGYSVTLHQVKVPSSFQEALNNTRIIVGAPKGKFPGGLGIMPSSTAINETGLVYNCPVIQGSCGKVGNGEGDDARLFDPDPDMFVANDITRPQTDTQNNVTEHKTQQLMGAVTVSSGEHFVACAPRYTVSFRESSRTLDTRRAIGRCFVSPRNLTGFIEMRPCIPSTGNSGNSNRCVAGTSAIINQDGEQSFVAIGAPGSTMFRGTGFLYQVNDSTAIRSPGTFDQSVDLSDQYEGYSMAVGNITGGATPDYIFSVPRANGSDYKGLVVVRSDFFNVFPTAEIRGTQLAEYFGWSVAAADLNGDGYDEIIVGAPVYSEANIQEHGRAYVFRNVEGNINAQEPIILSGDRASRARFGTSIVNLGDVNDDGYEDIAIGAPYQEMGDGSGNSGKVFIYYGSRDNFIVDSADQTISAADVVQTTTQTELKSFGFSLSSGVDVDNNEYLDLLVGAYESGTAVLFRALSVARIQISVSSDLTNNILPIDLNGGLANFRLNISASFSGRGLTEGLETMLNVNEIVGSSGTRRLVFDGSEEYSQRFFFAAANTQTYQIVNVSIKDKQSLYSGRVTTVEEFQIQFSLTQEPRVTPAGYNGNPANLTDLRTTPILVINGDQTLTVVPMATCGNGLCQPDLAVTVQNYIYSYSSANTVFTRVIAGSLGVDLITVPLRIENNNVDAAIGATLRISIPSQFEFNSSRGVQVPCSAVSGSMTEYDCTLPSFIGGQRGVSFSLTWDRRASANIIGTESNFTSSVSVMVMSDTDISNNGVATVVEFGAISDLEVTDVRFVGPSTYNSETPPSGFTRVDELGERVDLVVMLQNHGPSALDNRIPSTANVTIRLPTRDSSTGSNYYLYPSSYSFTGQMNVNVTCDESDFNLDGLQEATRRKRSIRTRRQENAAQDEKIPTDSLIKNCSASQDNCMHEINCTVRNWNTNQQVSITIFSYLDRRFFSTKTNPFTFVAVAEIQVESSVTTDNKAGNNRKASNNYSLIRMVQDSGNGIISIIIPIVAVIGALILIIGLFCILFFCGFFRRKRYDKEEPEEIQVRELPPEGEAANGETANGGKPAPPPGEEGEVTPDKETTPTKDPLENDIGDASDLHDGEIAKAEATDPDETSL